MPQEIKYDIRRGADVYRQIYSSRLRKWISTGYIKRGEVTVWRSGLSGWRRPEELEELAPCFESRAKIESRVTRKKLPARQVSPAKRSIKNILIIDDEEDLCLLLSEALGRKGYSVTTANTKRRGMACVRKTRPDLILLDLRLRDGDGMNLVSRINKINPAARINIISAYGSDDRKEEAKRKGADGFIDKPFTEEDILKNIKALS